MINYTNQVIKTVTLSNTIELTDEQLAGVVGGYNQYPRHNDDQIIPGDLRWKQWHWSHKDNDWNNRYWSWRHDWC